MNPTGTISDDDGDEGPSLALTRRFRAPIDDVWASLTEPARLARWFGTWTGHPDDGFVMVTMNAEAEPVPPARYDILECDPPRLLVVRTAGDANGWTLSVELDHHDGTTTLVFRQHGVDPDLVPDLGPGWEWYLDRFAAAVDGRDGPTLDDFERVHLPLAADYRVMVDAWRRGGGAGTQRS